MGNGGGSKGEDCCLDPARPVAVEYELRRQLAGCRLVGEIDLEGDAFAAARVIAESAETVAELEKLGYRSPATLAVYLVGSGAQNYQDDGYWRHIRLADSAPRAAHIGQAWERAVRALELEDFGWLVAAEGERYVTPILLHGTIPRRDVGSLARALAAELDDGALDVADALMVWRQGSPRFDSLNKPTKRFVRHGGAVATDLLSRIWDALLARRSGASEAPALPRYIAAEIAEMDLSWMPIRRLGSGLPQPSLMFDPWSGRGPELVMPATSRVDQWYVTANERQERFRASAISELQIEAPLATNWRVEGVVDDAIAVRRVFEGVASLPVFLFDVKTGELARDQAQVESGLALAVLPPGAEVVDLATDGPVDLVDEFEQLFDEWSGFRAVELKLEAEQAIEVRVGDRAGRILAAGGARRAQLVGSPVSGVTDDAGREVFDGLPALRLPPHANPDDWSVAIESPRESKEVGCAELASALGDPRLLLLDGLLAAPVLAPVRLRVRGPLGADLAEDITVVEGLRFDRPALPVAPDAQIDVTVSASHGVNVAEAPDGVLRFRPGVERIRSAVSCGANAVVLRFRLPRLLWSVWSDEHEGREDQATTIALDPAAFDGAMLRLGVSTGVPVDVSFALVDEEGQRVIDLGRRRTSETHARCAIDLRPGAETVRHLDNGWLALQLATGDIVVDALRIYRRLVVTALAADVIERDGVCFVDLVWSEEGPSRQRRALLWSEDRPWEAVHEAPLSESTATSTRLALSNLLPPGSYLVTVTGEASVDRPFDVSANVARVRVSEGLTEVPADFGSDNVGRALAGDFLACRVPETDVAGPQARELAVVVGAAMHPPSPTLDAVRKRAVELLFHDSRDSAVAASRIVEATHANRLGAEARVRVGIEVARTAVDCPSAELDDRQRSDLWETNRVLAAALDRPDLDDAGALRRWVHHTGWSPKQGWPYPGRGYGDPIAGMSHARLSEKAASSRAQSTKLLLRGGFDLANIEWLSITHDARDLVKDWIHGHRKGWLLPTGRRRFPSVSVDAVEALQSDAEDTVLRFPRYLTAAAMQFVLFGGNEEAARVALIDAAYFAPMLVERQLVLAIIHHLAEQGSILISEQK